MGEYASAGPNLLVPRQIPKNLDVGREFIQSQHVDDHAQRFDEQSSLGSLQHADSAGVMYMVLTVSRVDERVQAGSLACSKS